MQATAGGSLGNLQGYGNLSGRELLPGNEEQDLSVIGVELG